MSERLSEVRRTALRLMALWGLLGQQPAWEFGFNRSRRRMGTCKFPCKNRPGRIELSIHYVLHRPQEEDIRDTLLHEIAHARAGPAAGHGPAWQAWCVRVGARPNKCGAEGAMPLGRYRATCRKCGKLYHRHRRPKEGPRYYCRHCGEEDGALMWGVA